MRLRSELVKAPEGSEWRVARVWTERRMPRWTKGSLDGAAEALLGPDAFGENPLAWLAVVVGTVIVLLVVIPLLLFGIELILLGLLIAAAILGRALFGRPWLVRAQPLDGAGPALAWRVVGWRRSSRVIDEVASAISSGVAPRPLEDVERVTSGLPEPAA